MGKFASRDSTGTPVAWGDITGKPSTFDPNPHDNTAHSTAYAPIASPTFTGTATSPVFKASNWFRVAGTGDSLLGYLGGYNTIFGSGPDTACFYIATGNSFAFMNGNVGFGFTAPLSRVAINGGLHVGGESDAGDNNLLVDGTSKLVGNVRIGDTADATEKLEVAGNGIITGSLMVYSS